MPVMETINNIIGLSSDASKHATNLLDALLMLRRIRDLMDKVEAFNKELTGLIGVQGQGGNFPNVLRKGFRSLCIKIDRILLLLDQETLRIPVEVAMLVVVGVTLMIETFFTHMRHHHSNPNVVQFSQTRATAVYEQAKATAGNTGFSYFTGVSKKAAHYVHGGSQVVNVRKAKKPDPRRLQLTQEQQKQRRRDLDDLDAFAVVFAPVRQNRVTGKGREKEGAKPTVMHDPRTVAAPVAGTAPAHGSLDDGAVRRAPNIAASSTDLTVVYPARAVIAVKPHKSKEPLWFAELCEPLFQRSVRKRRRGGGVSQVFDPARPAVRYFKVQAQEKEGKEANEFGSEDSSKHFYIFEGNDRVSASAIYGAVELFEKREYDQNKKVLSRFVLSEVEFDRCLDLVSSPVGATPPIDLEQGDSDDDNNDDDKEEEEDDDDDEAEFVTRSFSKGTSRYGRPRKGRYTHVPKKRRMRT